MNNNLTSLKASIKKLNLDYFLLPNSDEFASEYLPEYAKRLQFITGFTGSNGFAIISADKNKKSAFFTDGRYTLQAATQVDQKAFEDDHDDHVYYQHDVVVVGDNDANEFPDYCDSSSFSYWKGQPPHAIGRRVMDWSFVLDEPFSEMDALQFTID